MPAMQKTGVYKRALAAAKASRKTGRKNKYTRFRNPMMNRTLVSTGLGFPKKVTMTHKYNEVIQVNTGANGALNYYSFSCNGMYDPNITGTGHQPMYFDQMIALYNHYCVIGSKIKVKAWKYDTGAPVYGTIVGLFINDDSTVTPTLTGCLENSNSTHVVINDRNVVQLTKSWSAKKNFGSAVLANTSLQGDGSSNPTEQSMFTIFFDSSYSITATAMVFEVEVEYIAVWKELKDIASS